MSDGFCACCSCFSCVLCSRPHEYDYGPQRRKALQQSHYCDNHKAETVEIVTRYVEKPDGHLMFTKLFVPKASSVATHNRAQQQQPTPPKAMLCYCIGLGDNTEHFFSDIGNRFANMGYAVFMFDPIGQGRSDGLFMHFETTFDDDIVADAKFIFDWAKRYYGPQYNIPASNYFLAGMSMGGAVAIRLALKHPHDWRGMIVVAPLCGIAEEAKPSACAVWCLRNCLFRCCPRAKIIPNKVNALVTKDEQLQALWEKCPVPYTESFTLNTGKELVNITELIQAQKKEMTLPFLIAHGTDDVLIECSHSQLFYENVGSENKTLKLYVGKGHLLYQEAPELFQDSDEWMMGMLNNNDNNDSNNDQNSSASTTPHAIVGVNVGIVEEEAQRSKLLHASE